MKSQNIDSTNKLGIYEKAINNKFSWEDKIIITAKAGFKFIELSIDESDSRLQRLDWKKEKIEELKDLLKSHNVEINSICLSAHRRFPFGSHDMVVRNKAREIMTKALEFAKTLGVTVIQLAGYDVYYEESDNETVENFVQGIIWSVQEAKKYNIILAFEIMDTPFMGTISKAMKYVNQINSPLLKIYPDLGNISQWTDSLEEEFEIGKNHIVGLHFKDTKPGIFKCVPFGQGTVDFPRLLTIISNIKYIGPILIEMWSENNTSETSEENILELSKAKSFYLDQWKRVK
ncbi:MAG: L-ribulose-5-phosphate 3-epimerase [Mycoplasmataceae bacterium]|nr:L-ribulose-5-phosphate 3-epimerase [Mycoplasmataceae bacterium]